MSGGLIFLLVCLLIAIISISIYTISKIGKENNAKKLEKKPEVKIEEKKTSTWGAGLSYVTCVVIGVTLFLGTVMAVCTLNCFGVISVDWISLGKYIWGGIKIVFGLGIIYIILSPIFDSFSKKVA
jgi:nitric oxide reductase large subunit